MPRPRRHQVSHSQKHLLGHLTKDLEEAAGQELAALELELAVLHKAEEEAEVAQLRLVRLEQVEAVAVAVVALGAR